MIFNIYGFGNTCIALYIQMGRRFTRVSLPALSLDVRHIISMSNLETFVKFSKKLTARSISPLPK